MRMRGMTNLLVGLLWGRRKRCQEPFSSCREEKGTGYFMFGGRCPVRVSGMGRPGELRGFFDEIDVLDDWMMGFWIIEGRRKRDRLL